MKNIITFLAAAVLTTVAFQACSGGGQGGDGRTTADGTLESRCVPETATMGEEVTCSVEGLGFAEGDTCLFGGRPVECTYDSASEEIRLIAPAGPFGAADISFQRGADDPTSVHKVLMVEKSVSNSEPVPPSAPTTPSSPTECLSNDDCVSGSQCKDGSCVIGTSAPEDKPEDKKDEEMESPKDQVPPEELQPLTAQIKVQKKIARLGVVKISWDVKGGGDLKDLYIYSGGLNRMIGDTDCNPVSDTFFSNGTRRLLVHSDGNDLNEDSEVYEKWRPYLDGARQCKKGESGEVECKDSDEEKSATPLCRIDLKDAAGKFKRSGEFYTRVLWPDATFVLYAKGTDGTEKLVKTSKVEAEPVQMTASVTDVKIVSGKAMIQFEAHYSNALLKMGPPAGCSETSSEYNEDGSGELRADCPLKKGSIKFSAAGIGAFFGAGNVAQHDFSIALEEPVVELKDAGAETFDCVDCARTLNLAASVSRDYAVTNKKTGEVTDGKTTAGITEVSLVSGSWRDTAPVPLSVTDYPESVSFTGVKRDHDHDSWRASVKVGVDTYDSNLLEDPYKPSLQVQWDAHLSASYSFHYDVCEWDEGAEDDDCCDTKTGLGCRHDSDDGASGCWNYAINVSLMVHFKHMKEISATCDGFGESAQKNVVLEFDEFVDPDNYGLQKQVWSGKVGGEKVICDFTAKDYEGQIWEAKGLEAYRGKGYCDGKDINDEEDPDDSDVAKGEGSVNHSYENEKTADKTLSINWSLDKKASKK